MNPGSIQEAQIKVARTTSAKHKAFLALIAHTIKQTEAMHILRGCIALPLATFSDGRLMELPVVSSHQLDEKPCAIRRSKGVTTNATGIVEMGLG